MYCKADLKYTTPWDIIHRGSGPDSPGIGPAHDLDAGMLLQLGGVGAVGSIGQQIDRRTNLRRQFRRRGRGRARSRQPQICVVSIGRSGIERTTRNSVSLLTCIPSRGARRAPARPTHQSDSLDHRGDTAVRGAHHCVSPGTCSADGMAARVSLSQKSLRTPPRGRLEGADTVSASAAIAPWSAAYFRLDGKVRPDPPSLTFISGEFGLLDRPSGPRCQAAANGGAD